MFAKPATLVTHEDRHVGRKHHSSDGKFQGQAFAIYALVQTWPHLLMNFNCAGDNALGEPIDVVDTWFHARLVEHEPRRSPLDKWYQYDITSISQEDPAP